MPPGHPTRPFLPRHPPLGRRAATQLSIPVSPHDRTGSSSLRALSAHTEPAETDVPGASLLPRPFRTCAPRGSVPPLVPNPPRMSSLASHMALATYWLATATALVRTRPPMLCSPAIISAPCSFFDERRYIASRSGVHERAEATRDPAIENLGTSRSFTFIERSICPSKSHRSSASSQSAKQDPDHRSLASPQRVYRPQSSRGTRTT